MFVYIVQEECTEENNLYIIFALEYYNLNNFLFRNVFLKIFI